MGLGKINFDLDDTNKAIVALMRAISLDDDDKRRHKVFTTHPVVIRVDGNDTKEAMNRIGCGCVTLLDSIIPAIEDKTAKPALTSTSVIASGVYGFFAYLEDSPGIDQAYHRMSVIRDGNEWIIGMYLLKDNAKGITKENLLMAIYWHIVK